MLFADAIPFCIQGCQNQLHIQEMIPVVSIRIVSVRFGPENRCKMLLRSETRVSH
jgi:hypothetical protein